MAFILIFQKRAANADLPRLALDGNPQKVAIPSLSIRAISAVRNGAEQQKATRFEFYNGTLVSSSSMASNKKTTNV